MAKNIKELADADLNARKVKATISAEADEMLSFDENENLIGKFTKEARDADETDAKMKKLAMDGIKGLIFTDRHLRQAGYENLLPQVFMPLGLGVFQDNLDDIGMIYEYLDQAPDMTINGFPMFMSCHKLTLQETALFNEYFRKYYEAMSRV